MTEKTEDNEPIVIQETIRKNNGEKIIKKYIEINKFIKNKNSTWLEVINPENMHSSAMAIIPKNNWKGKYFNRILKIHNSLHHKNIINIEHCFQDSENFYLLTEICHNGCLDDLIERRKKLSESEVKYYILKIFDLLKYLKKNNVIHRDLKLSYLLISDKMEIKISDFFCSIQFNLNENKITR